MKTNDFDYHLPPNLIAQFPLAQRDSCRLIQLSKSNGAISDHIFSELPNFILPGDRLIFNDTKVLPTRFFCHKKTGGAVELLLTEPLASQGAGNSWKTLAKPARRLSVGTELTLDSNHDISFVITDVFDDGSRGIAVSPKSTEHRLMDIINKYGVMALPHYIKRAVDNADNQTYQTIYARHEGAIACPTAGLHFTDALMANIKSKGVDISFVTLHVGIGTFRPVEVEDPLAHPMHSERYTLTDKTVSEIRATKANGGRIIAVGTTVVRVLEHCAGSGKLAASSDSTHLLILPGYEFRVIDGIVTNFHVPRSTLLMLISAFAGKDPVLAAYRHAVEKRYRFFSYGDAMLII